MSHKLTHQTEITDRDIAIAAIKKAGWSYRTSGPNTLALTSGPMDRATIDLSNGNVTGDTDVHTRNALGALRVYYGEQKLVAEILKNGGFVDEESRVVHKNGEIEFTYNIG
jgi:hypothetical protein